MKALAKILIVVSTVFPSVLSVFSEQGSKKNIRYSEYGAVGDGVTDDFDAIIKAHAAANEAGLKVCADSGATYYIGGAGKTAQIQTDTDWDNAKFIIDDTKVENPGCFVFQISSRLSPTRITTVKTLAKNQEKVDLSLPHEALILVIDNATKRYIRQGLNQNSGASQTEVFVALKNGKVSSETPVTWDYDSITSMTAYPIDTKTLTVSGGHFTTIANHQTKPPYPYYARGIKITRSNVVIDGIHHVIKGELGQGAPYRGFLSLSNCNKVTVQNSRLSGHKYYTKPSNAKKSVSMGTYDISVSRSTNVTFRNCKQLNDIHDTKLWGIFASNYSKNITFDTVEFSRFDAHMGVANATIRNSVLGHQGINLIGMGVFLVENTKVCGKTFINLRSDYGSTFEGEIVVRNCEFIPRNGLKSNVIIIGGSNSGQHDFGYTCHMPKKITIDGLFINDGNPVDNYKGPKLFSPFNNKYTGKAYAEKYPYVITKEVCINNLTINSGKPWIISDNPYMFRNVKITKQQAFQRRGLNQKFVFTPGK
jgi:hypothetical protein